MGDTILIETTADEVVSIVTQGPQGPSGAEAATLTTTGDLLYRAALANDRLPIGSEGQVLKVSSGLPAWGNESGAVTSVNGETGAVVLDAADIGAAPASGISPSAISGTAVVDSDPRLSDARTPSSTLAHSSSHHTGGADAIAPNDISAAWALETRQHNFTSTSTYTLAQGRNVQLNVSVLQIGATGTITLPRLTTDLAQNGDDVFVVLSGTMDGGQTLVIERYIWTGSSYIGSTEALVTTTTTGAWRFRLLSGQWVLQPVASHTHGNITNAGLVGTTANLPLKTGTGGIVEAGAFGTGAGEFAEGNHTHADLHTRSHAITSTSDHTAGNHKVFYSNGSGEIVELALGNSGEVLTSNGATSAPSFAAASGGGVTTGSVDNAILRADGTGGSTSQSSDINIEDATTSTQNNVTISNQHSGQTNSALVLAPKGNGPLLGQKPNGAASGGNSRGNFSTDFQRERTVNTRVASGGYSVICGGFNNSATNNYAFVGSGDGNQATGTRSVIVTGDGNTASGERSFIGAGNNCTASGAYSAILSGNAAVADRASLHAHANGRFGGVNGSAQRIHGIYFGTTTTNSAVTIVNLSVPASKVIAAIINIVGTKSDGSATAHFVRQYSVKNSGGTTSEVYAAQTIGTDSAASTSVTLSASDANDQLVVECTGIASETWRWVASVDAVEVSWAT